MFIGTLAIIGFPGLAGYFSKDAVIYGALEHGHPIVYFAGVLTAGITAYYMFRMLFVTFFGAYRGDVSDTLLAIPPSEHDAHAEASDAHGEHAPAWLMNAPVAILIVPSIFAGYVSLGGTSSPWYRWFGTLFGTSENVASVPLPIGEVVSTLIVLVVVALGIVVAYLRYGAPYAQSGAIDRLRGEALRMPAFITRRFWVDDAIGAVIVRPALALGKAFGEFVDPHVIDAGVRDVVWTAGTLGAIARSLQSGLLRAYALTIVVGAAVFIAYFALAGTPR